MFDVLFSKADPIEIILILGGIVAIWTQLRSSVRWHTNWIKQHDDECREFKIEQNKILGELQKNNGQLVVLVDSHCDRIDRLERWRDK